MFVVRTKFVVKTEVLLRTVYTEIESGVAVIGPTQVAEKLGVSKSTAQKMLNDLSKAGYGVYVPKKGWFSTKGEKWKQKRQ